ncbi:MAG: mechanosensitive ion channel [Betaproteobacteria bacterium]|nr:mechanosensitive ion channel [Betaproteobacteria bacterium]
MSLLHEVWKDTLEIARDPLLSIGKTDLTLLRLLGLLLIIVSTQQIAKIAKRSISKHNSDMSNPGVYLLSRLAGYFIWLIGALIGLNYLGFELSSFAFLGGAVGLGLGFGLQNILFNFAAGIIILFEKSIKVGDIVELQSSVTGKVAEINLRYIRITTPDAIDILVPNSEFISGRVVNWTFADTIRRIHIPFSAAYGTDKDVVKEAGIAAAMRVHTTINDDSHQPDVWLVRMGDNALEFELVVWINQETVKIRGATQANYLWALESELRKRAIDIPFPQRDLYLKNSKITVSLEKSAQS